MELLLWLAQAVPVDQADKGLDRAEGRPDAERPFKYRVGEGRPTLLPAAEPVDLSAADLEGVNVGGQGLEPLPGWCRERVGQQTDVERGGLLDFRRRERRVPADGGDLGASPEKGVHLVAEGSIEARFDTPGERRPSEQRD